MTTDVRKVMIIINDQMNNQCKEIYISEKIVNNKYTKSIFLENASVYSTIIDDKAIINIEGYNKKIREIMIGFKSFEPFENIRLSYPSKFFL